MKRFRGTGSRQRGRSVGTADTVSCTAKHRQPPPNGAQQQGDAARPWILQECLQCFKLHPQSSSSDSLEFKIFEPMPIIVAFQTSKLSIFRVWFESHAVHFRYESAFLDLLSSEMPALQEKDDSALVSALCELLPRVGASAS